MVTIDFGAGTSELPDHRLLKAHGWLMFVSFGILFVASILLAGAGGRRFSGISVLLQVVAFIVAIAGFALAYQMIDNNDRGLLNLMTEEQWLNPPSPTERGDYDIKYSMTSGAHSVIGLIVFIMFIFQTCCGNFAIAALKKSARNTFLVIGFIILLFAFVAMFLGFVEIEQGLTHPLAYGLGGYFVFVVLVALLAEKARQSCAPKE